MSSILCIGDVMLDVVVKFQGNINFDSDTKSKITTHGGGAAANTSAWLADLGSTVNFVGKVGTDSVGAELTAQLTRAGVVCSAPPVANESSGVVVVLVDSFGARTMFPDSGANSRLSHSDLPKLAGFDAAFLSGYALFNSESHLEVMKIVESLREAKIPIFFDPASVGTMNSFGFETARKLLQKFDVCILNESEANFLAGTSDATDALARLLEATPTVVIKCGASGAIAGSRNQKAISLPALETEVIDTTGAGDSFNAGFINRWVAQRDLMGALAAAIEISASCVAIIGARPSVNT